MRSISPLLIFAAGLLLSGGASALEEWSLDKQGNGIEVYTRPVAGSGIKEFKGTAEVDADVEAIMGVLRDSAGFKNWFPNTTESKLLAREGNVSHQYSVMGAPWPVSNRDNVLRSEWTQDEATGVVDITIVAAPDYYPVQEGRVRVRNANGTWKLEPSGAQKTRVTFTMHLDPGGGIPTWLINTRVVETPFEALTNLRVVVAK
jgi:hypothetical protein